MALLLPLLAVLIPLLILPGLVFYFDITPKIAALLVGASILVCSVDTPVLLARLWRTRSGRIFVVACLCQFAALVISTVFSANPALSLSGSNWRRYGLVTQSALLVFIVLIAARIASGMLNIRPTLRAIAVSGSVIAAYSCLQYFGWDPFLPASAYHVGEGIYVIVRTPGTLGHADYLGTYLLVVVFLGGSLLRIEQSRKWQAAGAIAAALGVAAIALSGTRSALVGLAAGLLFLLTGLTSRARTAIGVASACALLAILGFYVSPAGAKLRGRAKWSVDDPLGGARLLLWRDSLQMAAPRLLTGHGPETFSKEFPKFQSIELARAYPDFYHESAHNFWIDAMVGSGILSAAALLGACAFAAIAAWRGRSNPMTLALGSALIALAVSLQFNAFVLATAFFFWLIVAMLLAAQEQAPPEVAIAKSVRIAAFACSAAIAIVFIGYGVRLAVADVLLAKTRGELTAGKVEQAAKEYAEVRRWQPNGINSDLFYSRAMAPLVPKQSTLLLSLKAWQETVQAAIRATREAEDPQNAYYHLSALYASLNNAADAEKSLRGAIAIAPRWFKPHWTLAQVLRAQGRLAEAKQEAEIAANLDAGKHVEVSATAHEFSQ